ncbi:MAG TPA: DUF1330 domain-containing protein [Polyangiaceae bacterium]|nr:DUF1330 domain-containing protein [Polyangiaceae bacterium]
MSAEGTELPSPRRFTRLLGLMVDDQARYAEYRAAMTPILHAHGGDFGVDLDVARVLKSPADGPLNRVFTIGFPSREAYERFFANADYLAVRAKFFAPAVSRVCVLAQWED